MLKVLFTNSSQLIVRGLKSGFDNFGCETFVMDGLYRLWDKEKQEQLSLFKKAIEEFKPDLVFSECFANFAEELFIHTRSLGIPHFYWAIEDTPFDHWIGDYWSDFADYVFTTTSECLPNYWNKGKKAELLLFGCNKNFHKLVRAPLQRDIVLIANNYERRSDQTKRFIIPLIEQGYDISVFGNEWWLDKSRGVNLLNYPSAYKGYGAYEDLPLLYSTSKVIIGQNLDDKSITQTSMRPYEALAIGGGLLVSPYTPAQEFLFRDHVLLPRNTDEMIQMVDEVLKMKDSDREYKAKKAQEYVYKYHNYDLRAEQVLKVYYGNNY